MHTHTLPGGDLHYLHKNNEFFHMDITFFYAFYKKEDIHLLEHLILNHDRVLHISGLTIGDAIYEYTELNGFTSGVFLNIAFSVHKDDAFYLTHTVLELLDTPLFINQSILKKELMVLEAENKYNGAIDLFDVEYFLKYYSFQSHPIHSMPLLERIKKAYQDIVVNNRPYVLMRGNMEDVNVYRSIELVSEYLSKTNKTRFMSFDYGAYTYKSSIEHDQNQQARTLILFNRFHIVTIEHLALQILLIFLVCDALFYYVRFTEGANYDIFRMFRSTYYGWEVYFQVYTRLSVQELLNMITSMFDYDKNLFDELQLKVYRTIRMRDLDSRQEFYFLVQMFLYTGIGMSLTDLANVVLNINYDQFCSYYKNEWLKSISISPLLLGDKIPNS